MSLDDIHSALDASLATVDGLRHFPYPPTQFSPPLAYPVLERWDPQGMGRGGVKTYDFGIIVLVGKGVRPQDGYEALMALADSDDGAIELAIWDGNNTAADGTASIGSYRGVSGLNVHVAGFRVLGVVDIGSSEAFGGQFELKVTARS